MSEKLVDLDDQVSPGYKKAREWLVDYISRRRLEPGDKMPSERALADALGISRPTIAKAISELAAMGVLERTGRSGTYVRDSVIASITRPQEPGTLSIAMVMPYVRPIGPSGLDPHHKKYADYFAREDISGGIMQGALSVVKLTGCRIVIYHNNTPLEQAKIVDALLDEQLDGVIVWPELFPEHTDLYQRVVSQGPPFVFVDRYIPEVDTDCVMTDNFAGARDAVRCLIAKGHRRIGLFTEFVNVTSVVDREAGYRAALEEAGLPWDEDIICGPNMVRGGSWSYQFALEHCLRPRDPATAVFGIADDVVWAAYRSAQRLGLSVPGDLEVAGFFDAPLPAEVEKPFIRVVQDTSKVGQIAGELLLERISGTAPKEPRHVLVPPHVISDGA